MIARMARACTRGPAWGWAWGCAIGAAVFVYWYGTAMLDPTNIGWMSQGDPASYFLAWHYFRFEPWTFPLGMVRNYGEGLGTSMVVADAIPLVAFALKPFSAWLPERFQYFGPWMFACLLLNGVTAYALLARLTANPCARVVGTALFATAPFAIWRGIWHMSLVAHWQVLLAILLYLEPSRRRTWLAWGALLAGSGLTTAYLFAIVAAAWAAALVRAAWIDAPRLPWRAVAGIALATIGACALLFWISGVFSISGHAGGGGYGYNQFDLLALFDSHGLTRFHPGFAHGLPASVDHLQYLGLGASIAVPLAAVLWLERPAALPRSWRPLIAVSLLLLAFAITHRITIGGRVVLEVPMPPTLHELAAVFRASARMAWLFSYLLLAWAIATLANRLPWLSGGAVLVLLLLVGGIDASTFRPHTLAAANLQAAPLMMRQAEFVAALPAQYQRLAWVPQFHLHTDNIQDTWGYGVGAAPRGMPMNIAYVARYDVALFEQGRRSVVESALRGPIDPATVYVTRNTVFAESLQRLGSAGTVEGKLGDDFVVLPRFAGAAPPGLPLLDARPEMDLFAPAAVDIEFGSPAQGRYYLVTGWSQPETWGAWSEGSEARVVLPAPATVASGSPGRLRVQARIYSHRGPQTIDVAVNGKAVARWRAESLEGAPPQWFEAQVPPGASASELSVVFTISDPQRISDAPVFRWVDRRFIGFGLMRMQVE